ncbi:GGDEF domain-containing response regulator [Desulfolutivibrio sp.]|uniref:GGDEF domain-containing response regulator n=1 Tax=Desulfolutivibrio sp. TaxID=2773296 RepID=UPI002F962B3B
MKILVVDDSRSQTMLLGGILRGAGYEDIVEAHDAVSALRILEEGVGRNGDSDVDLILMDIVMPEMDGIEATKRLKADERFRDVPVIMVTVRDEVASLERALEAGANDYISKPVNRLELCARVRSVLRLKEEIDRRKARERELEALTERLEQLSNQDGLTSVSNRRRFEEVYDKEWLRARRDNMPLALLMIDIDFFKAFNDTYGHLRGDCCLKAVAEAICTVLKRPGDFVARFGGEEFVVILPATDETGALAIAEEIRENVRSLDIEHASSTAADHITVSIGAASVTPRVDQGGKALLLASDGALYQAKTNGRNRVEKREVL